MAEIQFQWFPTDLPVDLPVTQVSGFCFDQHGQLLLTLENRAYGIPGGKPEPGETREETLEREALEEVQCEISDLRSLGYQLVRGDGEKFRGAAYAQLRFAARITAQHPRVVDVATEQLIESQFVAPAAAITLLNWGEPGFLQISSACETMRFDVTNENTP
jgi:8-oxo-dGTP diphosphatase